MFRNFFPDKTYIIAEIGGNFVTFDEARRLIDNALECNVDAVKLQTYRADTVASKKAIFDMENTGVISQHQIFKEFEINSDLHAQVFDYVKKTPLDWFSTPSHESDVDLLDSLGVGVHKIGSDDAVNIPFLRYVARTGKPIILSTGMCTLEEVQESVAAIREEGCEKLILLHAITSYPTHPENVNLLAMKQMMETFPDLDVGYSDHTLSPVAALSAVAMGARVIERHFTYDKQAVGPDHMLSADPEEMKWLVNAVRELEVMKGTGVKAPAASEESTRVNNRKSLIASRAIPRGTIICQEDLAIKRPGWGIQPRNLEAVLGKKALQDIEEDEVLMWNLLG